MSRKRWNLRLWYFFIYVLFIRHSRITGQQGKDRGGILTTLHHFHPLHKHLDINRVVTAVFLPLHLFNKQTWIGNFRLSYGPLLSVTFVMILWLIVYYAPNLNYLVGGGDYSGLEFVQFPCFQYINQGKISFMNLDIKY